MWILEFVELAYQSYGRDSYHRQSFKAKSSPRTWFDIDSALKLEHAHEETEKHALELRRNFTQISGIDKN